MEEWQINDLIAMLKERRPGTVLVNGHGETSLVPGWHEYCNKLLDAGIRLHIISNFARPFEPDEIETLSRFKLITISIDTANPDLLKKTRRKVDLRNILYNHARVKACGVRNVLAQMGSQPGFTFSCVVHQDNYATIPELMLMGFGMGVEGYTFCNLTKYADVPDGQNVRPLGDMPVEDCRRALAIFDWAKQVGGNVGANVEIIPGLIDSLREKVATGTAQLADRGNAKIFCKEPGPGQTRDCLDPWQMLIVESKDGVVRPCCWHKPIGNVSAPGDAIGIIDSEPAQRLRFEISTGRPDAQCRICPARPIISVDGFRAKYGRHLKL